MATNSSIEQVGPDVHAVALLALDALDALRRRPGRAGGACRRRPSSASGCCRWAAARCGRAWSTGAAHGDGRRRGAAAAGGGSGGSRRAAAVGRRCGGAAAAERRRLPASSGCAAVYARTPRPTCACPRRPGDRCPSRSSAASVASKTAWSSGCPLAPSLSRLLQRSRDAAVLADPPEVDRQEDRRHERQRQHVQHVPAQQRVRPDLRRRPAAGSWTCLAMNGV